jgi:hypothetical protein
LRLRLEAIGRGWLRRHWRWRGLDQLCIQPGTHRDGTGELGAKSVLGPDDKIMNVILLEARELGERSCKV